MTAADGAAGGMNIATGESSGASGQGALVSDQMAAAAMRVKGAPQPPGCLTAPQQASSDPVSSNTYQAGP